MEFEESRVASPETVVLAQVRADRRPFLVVWVQGLAMGPGERSGTEATGTEERMGIGGYGDGEAISELSRVMAEP